MQDDDFRAALRVLCEEAGKDMHWQDIADVLRAQANEEARGANLRWDDAKGRYVYGSG